MAKRTCSLPDCDRPHKGNGYCHTHNTLFKRNGSPTTLPKRVPAVCAIEGCNRLERGKKGFCEPHLERVKLYGVDAVTADIRNVLTQAYAPGTVCSLDGCERPVETRGWCGPHYKRWWKHGDPTVVKSKKVTIGDGYKSCSLCDRVLPLDDFFRNSAALYGVCHYCKDCMTERRGKSKFITVAALRERDGDECYLCGRVMSFQTYKIGNYNPRRASIEHVIPRARGGEHVLSNVKLACLRCNIRKNDNLLSQH